jgi:hypothetical protein
MPLILTFRLLPPAVHMDFPAMRAHNKNLRRVKADRMHISIPLTVKERPLIPAQPDIFVTWRSIFFQTCNIDSHLDAFALLKQT